ncbi:MAG: hypothetical protein ACRES1_00240 [Steroidobacteraceae bacterium]
MEPNDLPIVCLPLELSDEAAATLIDFLYTLTEALERHYTGQLLRYAHEHDPPSSPPVPADSPSDDPPF